jgi:hypothetical protein
MTDLKAIANATSPAGVIGATLVAVAYMSFNYLNNANEITRNQLARDEDRDRSAMERLETRRITEITGPPK